MIALCLAIVAMLAFAGPTADARSHLTVSTDFSEFPDSVVGTILVHGDRTEAVVLSASGFLHVAVGEVDRASAERNQQPSHAAAHGPAGVQVAPERESRQARLQVEPNQSPSLRVGADSTFWFYALLENDSGAVVEIDRPDVPAGWSLQVFDSAGTDLLTDTDQDGTPDLGYVLPGARRWFSLDVRAPIDLVGDSGSLAQRTIVVRGHVGSDPTAEDSALLAITMVPGFSVHNFPNPLTLRTAFVIGLPEAGEVSLTIYTRAGERVCAVLDREDEPAGVTLARWNAVNDNGQDVAPGTYEYVLDYAHQGRTERIRKRLVVTRE